MNGCQLWRESWKDQRKRKQGDTTAPDNAAPKAGLDCEAFLLDAAQSRPGQGLKGKTAATPGLSLAWLDRTPPNWGLSRGQIADMTGIDGQMADGQTADG